MPQITVILYSKNKIKTRYNSEYDNLHLMYYVMQPYYAEKIMTLFTYKIQYKDIAFIYDTSTVLINRLETKN